MLYYIYNKKIVYLMYHSKFLTKLMDIFAIIRVDESAVSGNSSDKSERRQAVALAT
jgi:hypothetical protein